MEGNEGMILSAGEVVKMPMHTINATINFTIVSGRKASMGNLQLTSA